MKTIGVLLDDMGHAGISMGCSIAGLPLDHESFDPVWAELDRRAAVVYVHPATVIQVGVGTRDFHLAPDFMSPAEIGVTASRLIVTGFIQKFPNIKFIFATFGGGIPFLARRFDRGFLQHDADAYHAMGGVLKHYRHFWYDTSVTEDPIMLEAAKLVYGIDRMVLGTDVPRGADAVEDCVKYILDSPYLNDAEKTAILDKNAVPLFDLPAVARS